MNKSELIELICKAFKDIELGDGVGLKQAQAIDDYETKEVQNAYRLKDEMNDWSKIPAELLDQYHSSLGFFDSEGMRFHLPAYLIAEINRALFNDIHFHLVDSSRYALKQRGKLNASQKYAVSQYLHWYLKKDRDQYWRAQVEKALSDFWETT